MQPIDTINKTVAFDYIYFRKIIIVLLAKFDGMKYLNPKIKYRKSHIKKFTVRNVYFLRLEGFKGWHGETTVESDLPAYANLRVHVPR